MDYNEEEEYFRSWLDDRHSLNVFDLCKDDFDYYWSIYQKELEEYN